MGEGQPSPIKILRIHQIEEKFLKTRRTGESKAQAILRSSSRTRGTTQQIFFHPKTNSPAAGERELFERKKKWHSARRTGAGKAQAILRSSNRFRGATPRCQYSSPTAVEREAFWRKKTAQNKAHRRKQGEGDLTIVEPHARSNAADDNFRRRSANNRKSECTNQHSLFLFL